MRTSIRKENTCGWWHDWKAKCFIQADAHLRYTPQHKPLLLQLPNMKTIKMTVSFSSVVFKAVAEICRMLSESLVNSNCRVPLSALLCLKRILNRSKIQSFLPSIFFLILHTVSRSISDIRRSEELSLLKPPDDPSKKKKKKDKNSEQEDLWDIDLLSGGPGGTGTVKQRTFA